MPKINVKDKRRQQLIEANIASIAKRGYAETTIAHVSQGAGMSRGIVNFYFSTKESMMQETLKFLIEDYAVLWRAAVGEGKRPFEQLKAMVEAHFHKSWCNPKRLAVWSAFIGHASTHIDYRKLLLKNDAEVLGKIEELFAEILPGKEADNAPFYALSLHAMIRGAWVTYLLNPTLYDREQLAEQAISFMERVSDARSAHAGAPKVKSRPELVKSSPEIPEAQLDFGDLFAMKS